MSPPLIKWPSDPGERLELIRNAIPPDCFLRVKMVVDEAIAQKLPIYLVGGFVRDLLLGCPIGDMDIVVEGDAITLMQAVVRKNGGNIKIHSRFGTAQWLFPDLSSLSGFSTIDLISSRSEVYKKPGMLPDVFPGRLEDDLRRRDFTINTLAICLDSIPYGEMRNDLNGFADLNNGVVRILYNNSFIDDPTRLFRAVRYAFRYGFQISPETLSQIPKALPWISSLSGQRLRHELELILDEEEIAEMLRSLVQFGILQEIHPSLVWNRVIEKRVEKAKDVSPEDRHVYRWMLWLMHLSPKEITELNDRLHFSTHLRKFLLSVSYLYSIHHSLIGEKPSRCVAILDKIPLESIRAICLVSSHQEKRNLESYLSIWRSLVPKANGYTLKRLGIKPGPIYQVILQKLRNAWLDGEVKTVADENILLQKLRATMSKQN